MSNNCESETVSKYLEYLPAIFQEKPHENGVLFLGQFLLAFEKMLSGLKDTKQLGLEEKIDQIQMYFEPGPTELRCLERAESQRKEPERNVSKHEQSPESFLPWLANWVALGLQQDWSEGEKRRFISRAVDLYKRRGTKKGLLECIQAHTGIDVKILELHKSIQINSVSKVGVDTTIGMGQPHYFVIRMRLPRVIYEVTVQSLIYLKKKEVPVNIIEALTRIKGQEFIKEEIFLESITNAYAKAEVDKLKYFYPLIFEYSKNDDKPDIFMKITDQSLKDLLGNGLPQEIAELLDKIKNIKFIDQQAFFDSIQNQITVKARELIENNKLNILLQTRQILEPWKKVNIARSTIDREKPAHTHYNLEVEFPTMQIDKYSRVGVDTLIGNIFV